jgi:hypothetical protein
VRRGVGLAVLAAVLASAAAAQADDLGRSPPWAIRLEPGLFMAPEHLHTYGLVGPPPAAYVAASVERAIAGPVRANVSGGISLLLGWLIGGTIRYAPVDEEGLNVSIGVGPLFALDADFGSGTFAQTDGTVQLKIVRNIIFVAGGSLGIAMSETARPECGGVDTCKAYLARGDVVGSVRAGAGFAF